MSGRKILILNWRDIKNPYAGGAEVFAHEIAKRLVKEGYEITWFSSKEKTLSKEECVDGINIIRKGSWITVYAWAFFYYILRLRKHTDIILDCQNGIPFFAPLYSNKRIYCIVHHVHREIFKYHSPNIYIKHLGTFLESCMSIVYRKKEFISVSPSTITAMRNILHIKGHIHLVYNGINHDFFLPGKKSDVPLVTYLGRLKKYKKVDDLIKSFPDVLKKIPNAICIIAGTGEEKQSLIELTKTLGVQNSVSFEGFVTEERKRELLQKASLLVYPSLHEGWGISVIEANACGTPVIASDVAGLRDAVQDGETGLLFPVSDAKKLSRCIIKILSEESFQKELQRNSLDWSKKFDWDKSTLKIKQILETT